MKDYCTQQGSYNIYTHTSKALTGSSLSGLGLKYKREQEVMPQIRRGVE